MTIRDKAVKRVNKPSSSITEKINSPCIEAGQLMSKDSKYNEKGKPTCHSAQGTSPKQFFFKKLLGSCLPKLSKVDNTE
ncbi:hypothetical protein CYCME_0572 [Cycloclasticus zancles 78-ME]|uniref:Uncharacterized protein n=1 Tax=Cycloclasticus zancles 78-ME TaxID=1198232 RepID=S5TV60_9GAMM|nr:hypothetical protein CYCME_0572 [Cycloclasticus zancles 78-ME]